MMKFRKNQNKEKQIPKEKKPRVYKVNPHKKVVIALWVLLGLSFSFAIFKHFTAIDTHTIHETTIIEKEYVDTHHVENFVENFAKQTVRRNAGLALFRLQLSARLAR